MCEKLSEDSEMFCESGMNPTEIVQTIVFLDEEDHGCVNITNLWKPTL